MTGTAVGSISVSSIHRVYDDMIFQLFVNYLNPYIFSQTRTMLDMGCILTIKYTAYPLQKCLCSTELQWWSYNLTELSISTTDSVLLAGKMQMVFPTALANEPAGRRTKN